jgi:3-hydroxyisobutyrate dehydrogenase-like beta-hydroxyacid dehydrogenase
MKKVAVKTSTAPVGIVGLGIMGGAMAEALLAAGYAVTGYDPAAAAARRLKRAGGQPLRSAAEVAERARIVITSLPSSGALDAVAEEISRVRRGGLVVETSTLPIADKERARKRMARAGWGTLDCPVSGTAVRLKQRTWTIFVSGERRASARAKPVLKVFTDNLPHVGAFGNGMRMKMIANHLVAILNVASGETLTFARRMGLDAAQVLALFGPSPIVGTGVFRLRGAQMVKRRYRPPTMKVAVWQKDMKVIGSMARKVGAATPLFDACAPIYDAAMKQGFGDADTASVCEVLARRSRRA